ncbi:DUF748 domain-containing protein [Shewanella sp. C32]|uniref:DUF748 domain-containing protein n=1 Tax=Shewanella electrica TaxID=515560 RepID=A0ABT2FH20_9GAMM|nr:DUF748 domain-containing protein [Shewanella electrica]MCH1923521.1 DUF748 domain-containing protein [Shewanella electrica]MCS4555618.1 DUF748 domain-containing protein [Shewanella electrica]
MFASRLKGVGAMYHKTPRLLKISFWLLVAYLLYALILGAIVPAVALSLAPEKLSTLLGRQVSVSQLQINPFILRVRLDGIEVASKDNDVPLIALGHVEAEVNFWQSLFKQAWCIDHLTLDELAGQIRRQVNVNGQVGFNFDDIVTRLATAPEQTATTNTANGALPDVRIAQLALLNSRLGFIDHTAAVELAYHDITLRVNNFGSRYQSQPSAPDSADVVPVNQYQLSFTGQDSSRFTTEGQLQLAPLQLTGELQLNQLTLPPFWGYVQPLMAASLSSGALSIDSHFAVHQPAQGPLSYSLSNTKVNLSKLQLDDGDAAVIKLPNLAVTGIALNSQTQQVDVAQITADDLWLNSRVDQQGLALLPLLIPQATTAQSNATDAHGADISTAANNNGSANSAWLVKLGAFSLNNADINLREQLASQGVDWRAYPINLTTGSLDSALSSPVEYQLALDVSQQGADPSGHLNSRGSLDISAKQASGELQLTDLQLHQFQPYISQYLNVELPKGRLSSQGEFSANAAGQARYQGDLAIDELDIKDKFKHRTLARWQQLAVDTVDFDLAQQQLLIGNVTLAQPFAVVTINDDRSTNIGNLLVERPAATATVASPQTPADNAASSFKVTVSSVNVKDGRAFFADNSLTPNFATGIEQLHGNISSLSSVPGTKASVDIAGNIDRYAPMSLKGEINPLLPQPYLDLDLLFKSVELTSINPYSGTYAGYYIDKGQLTLALNYQLENNHLNGNNHLVIDQLKLGKPTNSKLATSLPVTLAIALLQDRHGVIDLGLPVSGNIDSPDFSISGIVWQAFTNVITKAVTAPFSFLGGLFGSDEELNLVAFESGSAKLSNDEQQKLQQLAQALTERPKLTLNVQASVDEPQDSRALAERKLQWQLRQQSGVEALPEDFSASRIPASGPITDALLTMYQQQFKVDPETQKMHAEKAATDDKGNVDQETLTTLWHIGLYNQLLNAQNVTDDDLGTLAQMRSQAVKAYLVDNAAMAPERVFLLNSKTKLNKQAAQAELTLSAN